jgi:hypothetical protein
VNVFAVLLVMIAIYGYSAAFDPRVAARDGRRLAIGSWIVTSLGAIGLLIYTVGFGDLFDAQPQDLATFALLFLPYGILMTFFLQDARVVQITTPALLVTHGIALAAIGDSDIDWLFFVAIPLTPLVLYAALRRKVGGFVRVLAYTWCMVVFATYTLRFIDEALVQRTDVSATLLALPFLLVRLSSFAAMLLIFIPSRDDIVGTYIEDFQMMLDHAQIKRLSLMVAVAVPAAAAGAMLLGEQLGQAGTAFILLYIAGQILGLQLQPPEYRGRRWWERAW